MWVGLVLEDPPKKQKVVFLIGFPAKTHTRTHIQELFDTRRERLFAVPPSQWPLVVLPINSAPSLVHTNCQAASKIQLTSICLVCQTTFLSDLRHFEANSWLKRWRLPHSEYNQYIHSVVRPFNLVCVLKLGTPKAWSFWFPFEE